MVVMHPGGPQAESGSNTPDSVSDSVSDIVNTEADEFLAMAEGAGFGVQKQGALKDPWFVLKSYNLFQVLIILRSRHSSAMVTHVH